MRIAIAMDSFKGTLSAGEACSIVHRALISVLPEVEVTRRPMADGGEGTAREMLTNLGGSWVSMEVAGPLPGMRVDGGFAWFPKTNVALVEMAVVNGLPLLDKSRYNPMTASTHGTGELIRAAALKGAEKILLAVGGSATVDGGTGAAEALGWKFRDQHGQSVKACGANLGQIRIADGAHRLPLPPVEVLCDVNNPLTGERGAARVFAPQKGATPEMVEILEAGMVNLARVIHTTVQVDVEDVPGAGAAGGLAGGAMAFMNATLVSGIETFIEMNDVESALEGADWLITGEGCFDEQSLNGKVISGLSALAHAKGVKVAVLAGRIKISGQRARNFGVSLMEACAPPSIIDRVALAQARDLLREAAIRLAQCIKAGRA